MKGLFGLVGLLMALAIVGVVIKKQLSATQQIVPARRRAQLTGTARVSQPRESETAMAIKVQAKSCARQAWSIAKSRPTLVSTISTWR